MKEDLEDQDDVVEDFIDRLMTKGNSDLVDLVLDNVSFEICNVGSI